MEKMKVLVTGCNGQLGWDLLRVMKKRRVEARGVDLDDFDLTDSAAVMKYVKEFKPTDIVHCAAYTAVDRAEADAETCMAVNGFGTMNIVRAVQAVGARLVYISTDYVFDGSGTDPWEVDDEPHPLNVYGLSKLQGELAVTAGLKKYFILRTSWVYGTHGNNFVKTMLKLSEERKHIDVVSDQVGSPTYTVDLAGTIVDMLRTEKYGIYHVCNSNPLSWADFARMIMQKAHKKSQIFNISSEEFKCAAKRPKNSRLSDKALRKKYFSALPSVENALDRFLAELNAE